MEDQAENNKVKPLKTYVLQIARYFPKTHSSIGRPTFFARCILDGSKIHTIRLNYHLWKKRIDEVNQGKAVISVREWMGKPYQSKQVEFKQYHKKDNIGIEKLEWTGLGWRIDEIETDFTRKDFAANDGLSYSDFVEWFNNVSESDPMAIIHFTDFRYAYTNNRSAIKI